jgi:Ca2+-transporting ATPase
MVRGGLEVPGLDDSRAAELRAKLGPNEIEEAPPVPAWRRFLGQFRDVVVLLLIGAAMVAGALGEWADTLAILAIVILNALLGFLQEGRANRALASLARLAAPTARVLRGGGLRVMPAREIVPGDVIEIEAGDRVPADARLVRAFALRTLEAALTGESAPVDKAPGDAVFMSTIVAAGHGTAEVTATGMRTEIGRLAGLIARYKPEPTPLQRRLADLGRVLLLVCALVAAIVFALEALRGERLMDAALLGVSLAVAAAPEGLPAVVTIALALGLSRMIRRNALIRRLPSVETLGSVTVICSDKTGTLTRNEMTVRTLWADDTARALEIGARCNNAHIAARGDGSWNVVGDPTDGALLVAARRAGVEATGGQLLYEIPFDSARRAMSVAVRGADGRVTLYCKGAPEVILEKSVLSAERRAEILVAQAEMTRRGERVLALAYRENAPTEGGPAEERELTFVGLVGMIDPPRAEAREAIERCRTAGIRPVMITGDHPDTALAIARELAIAGESDRLLTGADLDALAPEELAALVDRVAVFARVSPEHKLRIIQAWKQRGQLVAMTGDGVNDAPALRAADIGVAMGKGGTDVAREAADMVLTDDNFASIVNAVEEGRSIFESIQRVVLFLLCCNVGEILFMFVTALGNWPVPLMPIQLLWINLVTDGLPALALTLEPPPRDQMRRPPRPPGEPILSARRWLLILGVGSLVAGVTAAGFYAVYGGATANLPRARTMAFSILVCSQLFIALAFRSQQRVMPALGLFTNRYLVGAILVSLLLQLAVVTLPFAQPVFETATHLRTEWFILAGLSLLPVTVLEMAKLVSRWRA